MVSKTEENYLKAIFKISERKIKTVNTNAISIEMETTAASVTDMIKKLANKGLVSYEKYKGVNLTDEGAAIATQLIRKHRLWEVFLLEKLGFSWSEVHDIAEELEHIQSDELVNRLEKHLNYPKFDPHGDPIPNASGKFTLRPQIPLSQMSVGEKGVLVGVREQKKPLLDHLDNIGIQLGSELELIDITDFDKSMTAILDKRKQIKVSAKVASNLFIKK